MKTGIVKVRGARVAASVVLVVASLGLSACGSQPTATVTVTNTLTVQVQPSQAAPPPPPSPASTPVATPVKPASGHTYVFGDEWTTNPATKAQGSGCAPGPGALPDGVWFGFVHKWSTSSITFDLACWWTGKTAEKKAAADGVDAYDFYITNDNSTLRVEPVGSGAVAKKAGADDGTFTLAQVIADPGGSLPTNKPYPAWLYINGGVVTAVAVQYTP